MNLECWPIKTLDQLLQWTPECATGQPCSVKMHEKNAWSMSSNQPRTLLCHDMCGGYLADRFAKGCQVTGDEPYLFYHWSHIHGFIYFSHNFVTIPPNGWIDAAHRNGVPAFGTLITEWDDGKAIWERLTADPVLLKHAALLLVQIADHYGFDGWLINIENTIQPENVDQILMFLHWLRQASQLKPGKKGPIVIWYDSITVKGNLEWQNTLNGHNMKFFQFVDGIFLNYTWKVRDLVTAKQTAGSHRQYDVFVGVDVFGRGCYGGGGWNTDVALEVIRQHDMSVAMFAPGWVLECNESCDFFTNQDKFWSAISPYLPIHKTASLPIQTSFCVGYGGKNYRDGEGFEVELADMTDDGVCRDHWFDLSRQCLQPTWKGHSRDEQNGTMKFCQDDGWNGGGCLELVGWGGSSTWTVFQTDVALRSSLSVEVTLKVRTSNQKLPTECYLALKLRKNLSHREMRLLCMPVTSMDASVVEISPFCILPQDCKESALGLDGQSWTTLRFIISDVYVFDYSMDSVSLRVTGRPAVRVQLGFLQISESEGNL